MLRRGRPPHTEFFNFLAEMNAVTWEVFIDYCLAWNLGHMKTKDWMFEATAEGGEE